MLTHAALDNATLPAYLTGGRTGYDVWHGERVAARSRRRVFYDCPEQRGGLFCQHSANLVRCRRG
jgi:hypothetical protein